MSTSSATVLSFRKKPMSSLTRHPHFISLEGGEGAGKTTVLNALREALHNVGHDVVLTREPGGTPMAENIRKLLLDPGTESALPITELLMMFAARAQHVRELILPSLERGAWVLCDRFTDSSYAYQGAGRGIAVELIQQLEQSTVGIQPELTLLLDLSVKQGRERTRGRDLIPDRIERERDDFFERVRAAYLQRAQAFPERFAIIDASQTIEQVARDAVNALNERVLA